MPYQYNFPADPFYQLVHIATLITQTDQNNKCLRDCESLNTGETKDVFSVQRAKTVSDMFHTLSTHIDSFKSLQDYGRMIVQRLEQGQYPYLDSDNTNNLVTQINVYIAACGGSMQVYDHKKRKALLNPPLKKATLKSPIKSKVTQSSSDESSGPMTRSKKRRLAN